MVDVCRCPGCTEPQPLAWCLCDAHRAEWRKRPAPPSNVDRRPEFEKWLESRCTALLVFWGLLRHTCSLGFCEHCGTAREVLSLVPCTDETLQTD